MSELRAELETAINKAGAEAGSNTPDFILAEYLAGCLESFDRAVHARARWYGKELEIPGGPRKPLSP